MSIGHLCRDVSTDRTLNDTVTKFLRDQIPTDKIPSEQIASLYRND